MLKTGSPYLDQQLQGYPENLLTIIYGKPATGKTTIAMQLALEQSKNNKKVLFIDTENGFSLNRLEQLNPDFKTLLRKITIAQPKTLQQQENLILNLPKRFNTIIIDTIGKHYRYELKNDAYLANKSMDRQLKRLTEFIRNNVPVILCNQVYDNPDTNQTIMTGGKMMEMWCRCQMLLEKSPRKLLLIKPNKKEFLFEIANDGIVKPDTKKD